MIYSSIRLPLIQCGRLKLEFYLIASTAVLITGISKSGFAGGLGVLAVPMMSLFHTPQVAVTIMMPILLMIDCANIWKYRGSWSGQVVSSLLPGALLGLVLGALTFQWMNASSLKLAVGAMALLFAAQYAMCRTGGAARRETGFVTIFSLGTVSGFASFVAHAGGPPVKGYLLRQNMDKSEFVGTNAIFFFALNFLKAFTYLGMGQFTAETLYISASLIPILIVGVFLGFRLHGMVNQRAFTSIAYLLLAIAGVKLLWDGFAGFS